MFKWLTEKPFTTETDYPNRVEFSGLDLLKKDHGIPTSNYILRSSIGTARNITREHVGDLRTFMGYHPYSFDASHYSVQLEPFLLNQNYIMLPLGRIRQMFKSGEVFIRPNSGWKTFSGHILNWVELDKMKINPATICLVAAKQVIEEEFRFVVAGKEVISGSRYLPDDKNIDGDASLLDFVETMLYNIAESPDDLYVVDVGIVKGNPKFLEFNSFTCSGLYLCDIPKVCDRVEKFLEEQDVSYNDV